MLWSDPSEEPPDEMRQAQAMLRRAMLLIAVAVVLVTALVAWHG
ncbi:morphogenic membrane protein MmpB [Actinacidiphila sp. bgisy167]